jgi:hypothetical protein
METIGYNVSNVSSAAEVMEEDVEQDEVAVSAENEVEDKRDTVLALLANRQALNEAIKLMEKHEKAKTRLRHEATQYKYCTVLTTCAHCGVSRDRTVILETKGDNFVYIDKNDNVHIVTYKTVEEPCIVFAKTNFCDSCYEYIKYMDRSELEQRYIELLKNPLDGAGKVYKVGGKDE